MELNIESQKQEFLTICRASIQRDGVEDLLEWMGKADFFTAPASTHYHGAYAGGLCQHSIDVYQYAKKMANSGDCIALNHFQNDIMNDVLREINNEGM